MEEINLKLKAGSSDEGIENKGAFLEARLKMKVENSMEMQQANKKILHLLVEYYHTSMNRIKISAGLESFDKTFEIHEKDETFIST